MYPRSLCYNARVKKKLGKITLAIGRRPEDHEFEVAEVFARLGFDIEFLPENRTKGARSADIQMDGVIWEIKSPTGKGRRTVEKHFHRASGQSRSIIIDSRRSDIDGETFRKMVERQWKARRSVKRIILIGKDGQTVDFRR
jgi:hypothetical protein